MSGQKLSSTHALTGEKKKVEYSSNNSTEIRTDVLGNATKTFRFKNIGTSVRQSISVWNINRRAMLNFGNFTRIL